MSKSTIKNLTSDLRLLTSAERGRSRGFTLLKQRERASGFTLIELLIVVGIMGLLLVLMAPAFTYIKGGTDVTSAAYTIKGVLDTARTYAKANNTYTWVGFYEENGEDPASPNTTMPAVGRVIISTVASKDGSMLYGLPLTGLVPLAPASLIQVGKPAKIDNFHLKTFVDATAPPPPDTFDRRPAVGSTAAKIGDDAPPSPALSFQYPLTGTALYTFAKIVQFGPGGEGVIDNSNYSFTPVSEIGIQPAHGSTPDTASSNVSAIQFTGMAGNVKIYRR